MERHPQKMVHQSYVFCPNLNQSPFQNAVSICTSSTSPHPLLRIPNLAFNDLTTHQIVPHETSLVLGLELKFILTPKSPTLDITSTLSQLYHDIHLRTFFAGDPSNTTLQQPSKLYIKSTWNPPHSDIPRQIYNQINTLSEQLMTLFQSKPSTPNLLPFQMQIYHSIISNPNLLFPNSDKGLGPCAVTYDQYITNCLTHLQDTTT